MPVKFPELSDLLDGKEKIVVVGLGYVGLPLLVALSKKFKVIGYDINKERVEELARGFDKNREIEKVELSSPNIKFTYIEDDIGEGRFIIVAVPTPVDAHNIPNLSFLKFAAQTVGRNMRKGSIVVFESTVYPGATEEICVPILAKHSEGEFGRDFKVGYSPERINPGDKEHTIYNVTKIVSGSDKKALKLIAEVYGEVIKNIYKAPDIKTAEAAKVIENTQRDLNIALMNELSVIFHRANIDTKEVLRAAATKWNFLRFEPGLVGGHCIGVDPYYLTYKAEELGYHPDVILAGRRINDEMGRYVAGELVKLLIKRGKSVKETKVLILGFTFKENINDIRNTKVIDIVRELKEYGVEVYIYDPHADKREARKMYDIELSDDIKYYSPYDAIVVAVKHREFLKKDMIEIYREIVRENPVFVDIKGIYDKREIECQGFVYWRL